jgi:hypothetical protein
MRTRRAPELAAGHMTAMVRQLLQQGVQELLFYPEVMALENLQRARLLREYQHGRQHLVMTFDIKFGHWRQLPWVIIGIAHPDRITARDCGDRALRLYGQASPEIRRHPIVETMCKPGSPIYDEVRRFVYDGMDIERLPTLQLLIGKFLFIPIAERWVEALHASAQKDLRIAPRFSVVHVAWRGIYRRLNEMISKKPEWLNEFAECAMSMKNPVMILKEAGFWFHPGVQGKLLAAGGKTKEFTRGLRRWAIDLVYHADSSTVYKELCG